ncbi:hypothetical protein JMJ35_006545 [Cladonia borealis]|uniref:Uncharacterized protein n=1 Tax=Cladonia borealis TaxID=184061 RepID=A0AA39QXG7_9LECA|nr:hypothetical protein JMJ35_006545 [Cladonia borealis]
MSPGQMENQKTSVEYRPLRDSEIRLVSFQENQGASSPFELRLEHFESPKAPSYIAISYTVSGQPSWVNGFHLDTPWHIEPAVRHTGCFSSDGESLVVEGVRCGKILSFFFGGNDMTGERMQHFYDTILFIAGEIRQQPHADAWKEWLSEFLEYACRVPGDHANRYQSVSDFLANALPGHSNGLSDGFHGSSVLKLFSLSDFALVDDGKVVGCERRPAQGLVGEFQVWAFKGSTNLSIVHQERPDKYRYHGWLRTPDVVLNEEFFSSYEVERITLI